VKPLSAEHASDPSLQELIGRKAETGLTVSVCLPALNEGATVGPICRTIASLVTAGLVDQLVVVDSGSSDNTREAAEAAGAAVFQVGDLPPAMAAPGKGGTLWKSLGVLTGDLVVWLDSDTRNFDASFVTRLVAPFLSEPEVRMTKAFYERPLEEGSLSLRTGGARVTELVVRPLAHLLFPELTVFVQPLSGEYAAYREDLLELPFFSGYGVEVGLLIDFITRHGSDAIRQVDLGARVHRNQDILALGRMGFQVMQVITRRAEDLGRLKLGVEWPPSMVQFVPSPEGASPESHRLEVIELPPLRSLL
jgi:glucosyl-3-phosphoglycerate synthase